MMLSTDIMPAGMTVPVRRYLGPKYPSNSSETINAVPSPACLMCRQKKRRYEQQNPVIAPAMTEATLPALT